MAKTRPSTDQIRFLSQANGVQILDEYMEEVELGGRSLASLLQDIFTPTGSLRPNLVEFRYNPALQSLQVRPRQPDTAGPDDNWVKLSNLFRDRGDFAPAIQFENLDIVRTSAGDLWIISGLPSEPFTFADESDFIASPYTNRVFNVAAIQSLRDEVVTLHGEVDTWHTATQSNASSASSDKDLAQSAKVASEAARDQALAHRDSAEQAATDADTTYQNLLTTLNGGGTFTGNPEFTGSVSIHTLTITGGLSDSLAISLGAITDWPSQISPAEISHLDGVTSGIQGQINSLAGSISDLESSKLETDINGNLSVPNDLSTGGRADIGTQVTLNSTPSTAIQVRSSNPTIEMRDVDFDIPVRITSDNSGSIRLRADSSNLTDNSEIIFEVDGTQCARVLPDCSILANGGFTQVVHTAIISGSTPLSNANGTIKDFTLGGNVTFTDDLSSGQSLQLLIDDGAGHAITWPASISWLTPDGLAPSLHTTRRTPIRLQKVSGTLYGQATL